MVTRKFRLINADGSYGENQISEISVYCAMEQAIQFIEQMKGKRLKEFCHFEVSSFIFKCKKEGEMKTGSSLEFSFPNTNREYLLIHYAIELADMIINFPKNRYVRCVPADIAEQVTRCMKSLNPDSYNLKELTIVIILSLTSKMSYEKIVEMAKNESMTVVDVAEMMTA